MKTPQQAPPGYGAIFVDRDGVITIDRPGYTKRVSEMQLVPGAPSVLKRATDAGIRLIVVTNQSVINRGLASQLEVERIHRVMTESLRKAGCRIEKVYFCPHTPDEACDCRKPKPGMLFRASKELKVDLSKSCLIGDDRVTDMGAARNAGCQGLLVRRNDSRSLGQAIDEWVMRTRQRSMPEE